MNKHNVIYGITVATIGVLISASQIKATPKPDEIDKLASEQLILQGTYLGNGNIYSPEISGNKMYFSGWYTDADYPHDAIYVTDLNNITNVRKILQFNDIQIGDPTIVGNNMFMTLSPDPLDLTKHVIAVSTTNDNGNTWSDPINIINQGWLPSAIQTDNVYVYYTYADLVTNQLRRARLINNQVVEIIPVVFDTPNFYPINIDVEYYDNMYYLLGGYYDLVNDISTYCTGLWLSDDGLNFTEYHNNPLITPSKNKILTRTPFLIKENNKLRIWYTQQQEDWWTNAIYYIEKEFIPKYN